MKYRIFISSVQSEFAKERKALAKYIREDALLGDFFEIFLFEEAPARNRSAQAVYLDEVERQRHGSDHRQVYRTWPRASRVRSDVRLLQDNHLAYRKRRSQGAQSRGPVEGPSQRGRVVAQSNGPVEWPSRDPVTGPSHGA